jgi:hypothetical protein
MATSLFPLVPSQKIKKKNYKKLKIHSAASTGSHGKYMKYSIASIIRTTAGKQSYHSSLFQYFLVIIYKPLPKSIT